MNDKKVRVIHTVAGVVAVLCLLFCVLSFSLGSLLMIPIFCACYMMPNYMKFNPMPWFMWLANGLVKICSFSSATLIVGMMTVPVTETLKITTIIRGDGSVSSNTTKEVDMDSLVFKIFGVLLIIFAIFVSIIVMMFFCVVGFIRNYVMGK